MADTTETPPPTDRTRVKRFHHLGHYDRKTIYSIIDASILCHIGYVFEGAPFVTPCSHWRIDDYVYWHGSAASRMLRTQSEGVPICFTVTHLDGLVFSRAAFDHNLNFRSVMAFGNAELCDEETKRHALAVFTDRLAPGLWDHARKPAEKEWTAAKVLRLKLDEASAKVRTGPPLDSDKDKTSDAWAGT
ncbi:pyridoxamine 5'-phosphate oxidase family protein, partial [Zymomonas mobilis]